MPSPKFLKNDQWQALRPKNEKYQISLPNIKGMWVYYPNFTIQWCKPKKKNPFSSF